MDALVWGLSPESNPNKMRTYKVCKTGTPSGNSHVCPQEIQFEKSLRKPMGMTKMNGPPQTCPSSHYMNRDCHTPMTPLAQDTIFKNPTGFPKKYMVRFFLTEALGARQRRQCGLPTPSPTYTHFGMCKSLMHGGIANSDLHTLLCAEEPDMEGTPE